jgi:hypothetical protein
MKKHFQKNGETARVKFNLMTVFLGALVITALATNPVLADKPRITSDIKVAPAYELSADEQKAISHSASRILKHADQARDALAEKSYKDAEKNVDQALRLVEIIENVMPDYKVKAEIEAGDLTYSDEENVKPATVTIYEELEKREILTPVKEAKQKEAEKKAEKENLSLPVDIDLVSTKAELNVAAAKASLEEAKKNLKDKKYKAADTDLRSLQTDVILTYAEVDLPLTTARKNLVIAKNLVDSGDFREAEFVLNVATDALERYEESVGEHRAKESKELRDEINKLSKKLSQDPEASSNKLEEWWNKILEWFE